VDVASVLFHATTDDSLTRVYGILYRAVNVRRGSWGRFSVGKQTKNESIISCAHRTVNHVGRDFGRFLCLPFRHALTVISSGARRLLSWTTTRTVIFEKSHRTLSNCRKVRHACTSIYVRWWMIVSVVGSRLDSTLSLSLASSRVALEVEVER
jgi:hypothetical protein